LVQRTAVAASVPGLMLLAIACTAGTQAAAPAPVAKACSGNIPPSSQPPVTVRLGLQLGPLTTSIGTRVTVLAMTSRPIYFRPATLGCVLRSGLQSPAGNRTTEFVVLRTGTAQIWNVISTSISGQGKIASQGILIHIKT
jgi:hypothetical protein